MMYTRRDKDGNVIAMTGVFPHHRRWITADVKKGIRQGDKATLQWLQDMVRELANTQTDETGNAMYSIAQECTHKVVQAAQGGDLPQWLLSGMAGNHRVPWQMVNGKPADGFDELDAQAGHTYLKRGKQQFAAAQTRDVAEAIRGALHLRELCRKAPHWYEGDTSTDRELRAIAKLPDLTYETKDKWWRVIKPMIKRNAKLTDKELFTLKASADYPTERGAMREYLKRCKAAVRSLCPADK
jgi:hypothetical protein